MLKLLTLYRPNPQICNASHLFLSIVNETGFRATVHINRFVAFRTQTLQLKILKNQSSVNFKTRFSSSCLRFTSTQCRVAWGGWCWDATWG